MATQDPQAKPSPESRSLLRDIVHQRLRSIGFEDQITWELAARLILLTEKELAQLTGFSKRTLQGFRAQGGTVGPRFVAVSARCIKYRICDIDEWIQERLRASTSDDGRLNEGTLSRAPKG